MNWIKRIFKKKVIHNSKKANIPEGIWTKCNSCHQILYHITLKQNLGVCPKCDYHMRIHARDRLENFLDPGNIIELGKELAPKDFLNFKDKKKYKDRLLIAQKNTGEKDALIVMKGKLYEIPVIVAAFEFFFMGGSMGCVVGSKFVCAVEEAIKDNCPFICFSSSGGARMQESLYSLMQMAKTTAVLAKMKKYSLPYISILTDPTMGGVSASFAMLGDLNIAEPGSLIGFAGPRIIEQTMRKKLPINFQKSEFLIEKGIIDIIIRRLDMRKKIAKLIAKLMKLPEKQ